MLNISTTPVSLTRENRLLKREITKSRETIKQLKKDIDNNYSSKSQYQINYSLKNTLESLSRENRSLKREVSKLNNEVKELKIFLLELTKVVKKVNNTQKEILEVFDNDEESDFETEIDSESEFDSDYEKELESSDLESEEEFESAIKKHNKIRNFHIFGFFLYLCIFLFIVTSPNNMLTY